MKHKTVIPDGYEIDVDKSTFEEIVFKKLSPEYPLSVKEISHRRDVFIYNNGEVHTIDVTLRNHDINNVSTKDRAYAFLALMQLVELRDAWNHIDGNVSFRHNAPNYCIVADGKYIRRDTFQFYYRVLHFRKRETRDLFFETFKDLIEQAKELI